jgi:hypothetical protein
MKKQLIKIIIFVNEYLWINIKKYLFAQAIFISSKLSQIQTGRDCIKVMPIEIFAFSFVYHTIMDLVLLPLLVSLLLGG